MNLIYYYPMDEGSPSNVARKLLTELIKHAESLPFNEIVLFSKPKNIKYIKENFQNLRVISYKELSKESEDYIVHFPILPTVLPNSKFLLFLYSRLIKRKKIIIQYHGDVRTELRSSYKNIVSFIHILTYVLLPYLFKSADKVIIHSYYMNDIIRNYGVLRSAVIPNAVDNYWFLPEGSNKYTNYEINEKKFNVFYHGRLSWEKGIDLLLIAAENHIKNNPDTMIYLAGEGPQREYLKNLCSKLNIRKNIVFLGTLNKEGIKFFLKNVDLAVYPSRFDSFSLAVLEALSCANCPVYFSKRIGLYDFVTRDNFNLNSFELSVLSLTNILDSALSNRNKWIIDRQREFAKNYTWNSVIFEYIKLYYGIIGKDLDKSGQI